MRIAVCSPQVPFARGGAEILAERLTEELRERGHEADLVTVPFKWYPAERVLTHAFMWRLLDLEEVDGGPVDLVIATKFPSYVVRHPNKVVWLVHQFRQAYELDRTELGQFGESPGDRALRRKLHELDRRTLGEARRLCSISRNVSERLERTLGLEAEVVLPPPQALDFHCERYDGFILSVNRLDRAKRIDLLLEALAAEPALEAVIAGDGPDRERLEALASRHGLNGRVRFAGRVSTTELSALYATCRAVYYEILGGHEDIIAFGTSMGAYQAMQFAFQRADLAPLAIGLSGSYDGGTGHVWGERGDGTYFTNAADYVASLDEDHLDWLRQRLSILLVCGQGEREAHPTGALPSTRRFAELLSGKGIAHQLDLWGNDVSHDWPWWGRQLAHHLPRFC